MAKDQSTPSVVHTVRVPRGDDARIRSFAARKGFTYTHVLIEGARRLLNSDDARSDLINQLHNDLSPHHQVKVELTFALTFDGTLTTTAARRMPDGALLDDPWPPLEQFVRVVTRPNGPAELAIELHGMAPDFDGVVVNIATLPAKAGVSMTVDLMDLDPGTYEARA